MCFRLQVKISDIKYIQRRQFIVLHNYLKCVFIYNVTTNCSRDGDDLGQEKWE